MAGKWRALEVKALILSLDTLAVAFYCHFKWRKAFDRLGRSPNLETFTWQKLTKAKRVIRSGGQKKILQNDWRPWLNIRYLRKNKVHFCDRSHQSTPVQSCALSLIQFLCYILYLRGGVNLINYGNSDHCNTTYRLRKIFDKLHDWQVSEYWSSCTLPVVFGIRGLLMTWPVLGHRHFRWRQTEFVWVATNI